MVAVLLLVATSGKNAFLLFQGDFRKCCVASCLGSSNGTCCAAIDVWGQGGCILSQRESLHWQIFVAIPSRIFTAFAVHLRPADFEAYQERILRQRFDH